MLFSRTIRACLVVFAVIALASATIARADDKTEELKADLAKQADSASDASDAVKQYTKDVLIPLSTNEVFVAAVADRNAKGVSLDDIKAMDEEWINAEDVLPIHEEMMGNACAKEIKKICTENPAIGETFVMDNQGANVGQNELTSDYWQGDEPKWADAFKDGQGALAFSKPKMDKSTGVVDQKISVPIIDETGQVIGVVCFGIDPSKL